MQDVNNPGKTWIWLERALKGAAFAAYIAAIIGLILSNMSVQTSLELTRKSKVIDWYSQYYMFPVNNPGDSSFYDTTFTFNKNNWDRKYSGFVHKVVFLSESIYVLEHNVPEWKATLEKDMLYPHLYFIKANPAVFLNETYNKEFRDFCGGLIDKYCKN